MKLFCSNLTWVPGGTVDNVLTLKAAGPGSTLSRV